MDADQPLFAFCRAQLRRLRAKKGWSQEALGKRIGFSGEMVSKVETGSSRPSPDFAAALDLAFPEMNGMFAELVDHAEASRDVHPEWFRSWVDAEQRASVIRWWQPLLVPSLLQVEGYIRAVYEAWRAVDGNPKIDADVAARLDRQSILDLDTPPSFGAVLDESVLYREIGGPDGGLTIAEVLGVIPAFSRSCSAVRDVTPDLRASAPVRRPRSGPALSRQNPAHP